MTTPRHYPLAEALGDAWWLIMLRGAASLIFGLLAVFLPELTLLTLIILYGVYAILDGVFALGAAIYGAGGVALRWWLSLAGLVCLATGVVALAWPGLTAVVLVMLIGASAVLSGVMQIYGAIRLRREIEGEWFLVLLGAVSALFGIALIAVPGAGALALVWFIGVWAIVIGALAIALSLRLRKLKTAFSVDEGSYA